MKKPIINKIEFDVLNFQELYAVSVEYFLKIVTANLSISNELVFPDLYEKLKLFIAEILSNYKKHSTSNILNFKLFFYDDFMIVEIANQGNGFPLYDFKTEQTYFPPYPKQLLKKDILISCIEKNLIFAYVVSPYEIYFHKEKLEDIVKNYSYENFEEKFGLGIISELTSKVIYIQYPNNLNIFKYYIDF